MYMEFETPEQFAAECNDKLAAADRYVFICLSRTHQGQLPKLVDALNAAGIKFFGALFPALINEAKVVEHGAIVKPFKLLLPPVVLSVETENHDWFSELPKIEVAETQPTCMVLADFSCVAIAALLEELFDHHGNEVSYFGAGCGNGERTPQPVVFTNDGLFEASAIVAYIDHIASVNLRHGWTRIAGPTIATKTEANVIQELDWEPARDVYKRLVGGTIFGSLQSDQPLPDAKLYPIGIEREGMEDVVRDLLVNQDPDKNDLAVLSNVPENSVIYFLHGDREGLVSAAEHLGGEILPLQQDSSCLMFDCFSRAVLLGDQVKEEIKSLETGLAARSIHCNVQGALALGEIASNGEHLPDFHNKTMAIMLYHDI